jgi:guanylate kinase
MSAATPMRRGRLVVLSAPSGAGKTTLVKALVAAHPELRFSISYTTRPARPGEEHGRDYFFVAEPAFLGMIEAGEFLEHALVFGNRYGTSRAQIEDLLARGHDVLLEIDWQGARQIRANAPGCRTVFILPPSLAELERRLRGRGTDAEDVIQRRLAQARDDMDHWAEFDHVIINDRIDDAADRLGAILRGEDPGCSTRLPAVRDRVAALLAPA